MKKKGLTVNTVTAGSIADEIGMEPGDTVLSVNNRNITDILDYYFYINDSPVYVEIKKGDGTIWDLEIEKDPSQNLGIEFKTTGLEKIKCCSNKCIFCFVDQMPGGLRESLYMRDDDYRLSFMQGSFITLTNMSDRDLNRISELRLSPLYISVHTTNPILRKEIMRNPKAGEIYRQLSFLASKGIEIHTQAVICPGINDGEELANTVADMITLWPSVRSLAIVPVGLTSMRGKKDLFPVRRFKTAEAIDITTKIDGWQASCLKTFDYPFVFASDEFYCLAGREIPPIERYADFPQTENGVGLTRLFLDEWKLASKKVPNHLNRPLKLALVTGILGESILRTVLADLDQVKNLKTEIITVNNSFFGNTVTVSGLLTGQDILKSRDRLKDHDLVILPASVTRRDSSLMLDGMKLEELQAAIGTSVMTAAGPEELVRIILDKQGDRNV